MLHGDGTQSRDFTFVGTVCEVILDALRRRVHHPHPVNLAFGARASLLQVLDELTELLDRPIAREYAPPRVGDVPHSLADNTTLRALFPDVVPTDRTVGLRATIEWMAGLLHVEHAAQR